MRESQQREHVQSGLKSKEIAAVCLDVLLFTASLVFPMHAIAKWITWLACWMVFIFLVQPLFYDVRLKRRLLTAGVGGAVFFAVCWTTAHSQWREENAAQSEGYLRISNPVRLASPTFQIADSGTILHWNSKTPLKLFKDAEVGFSLDANGVTEISTTVLDRYGHRIVKIEKNHWSVEPRPASVDKNFRDDALEVLDGGGQVVLQIRLLPDRMVLWGEWHNEFDQAAQITDCTDPDDSNRKVACVEIYGPALPEKTNKVHIEPLFEYPSKNHWGDYKKTK
jgi:hypothetical protein